MPSAEEINTARQRGNEARQLLEGALLGAPNPDPSQALNPSLPAVATRGLANLFTQSFPDQPPPAFQPAPTVDSRTGQEPTDLTATGNPVVVTDAHARADRAAMVRPSTATLPTVNNQPVVQPKDAPRAG